MKLLTSFYRLYIPYCQDFRFYSKCLERNIAYQLADLRTGIYQQWIQLEEFYGGDEYVFIVTSTYMK